MAGNNHNVGDRLSFDGAPCTVRYVGEVRGTGGSWLGVEWDDPARGKHEGSHKGVRYFSCESKSPTAASFVRPSRRTDPPLDFLSALHEKYASEEPAGAHHEISGKVVEEVGFDKIRRKLAQLHELKIVILDGMRIAASAAGGHGEAPSIRQTSPKVTELDLSRNLFTGFGTVAEICSQLEELKSLRLNGNRFQRLLESGSPHPGDGRTFANVKELALDETLLSWEQICLVASRFPVLHELTASANQLTVLPPVLPPSTMAATLTNLVLEYNDFSSLVDIAALTALQSLRNLHLKGNNITSISRALASSDAVPIFPQSLRYLDIAYNQVIAWSFIDALPASFPGLISLRFAHNPIYDAPESDTKGGDPAGTEPGASISSSAGANTAGTATTEEAYMITVARLGKLQSLNFSSVSAADRNNAEMFYLARIARQLAAVPEGSPAEAAVLARHPRWRELCDVYGEPEVVRRQELNPNFLEARLIKVVFYLAGGDGAKKTVEVPKSFDIYRVKGIVGRLFGHSPLKLRLVWETGEWDPVAGFDDEASDSSDDDDERRRGRTKEDDRAAQATSRDGDEEQHAKKDGKWVKREVEIRDGPRQFGYCVDGPTARVRVELA